MYLCSLTARWYCDVLALKCNSNRRPQKIEVLSVRGLCREGRSRGRIGRLPEVSVRPDAKEALEWCGPQSIVKGLYLRQGLCFSCFLACFGLKISQHYCMVVLKYSLQALVLASQCVTTDAMVWCCCTYLFWGRKTGIPQCFSSPASKSGGDALSSVSHLRTLVAVMGVADSRDMARRVPKFVTGLAGKNCMKAFHGSSGSGDTGSPRDMAAESCLCPWVQQTEALVLRPALHSLKRHRSQWPLAILQHSASICC